ncbi:MAG: DNA-binding protein [Halomonas sp.]|nr:DNA-binding protein [Halomonas sp.]
MADTTLEQLITDCGGPTAVGNALGIKAQSICDWMEKGRLPWTELDGRTAYSDRIAKMQQTGKLTARQIRRLGLRL